MTAKKVVELVKPILGYILMENCNDGDVSADHISGISFDDVALVGNDLLSREQVEDAIKDYDGSAQLLVGEIRISHITVRTLKEI